MTPAEVLEKAADLLETIGWVQGEEIVYGSNDPDAGLVITGMCARGACRVAVGLDKSDMNAPMQQIKSFMGGFRALHAGLNIQPKDPWGSVPGWNDFPGRTADEVIDMMKRVAKDLRNEEAPQVL